MTVQIPLLGRHDETRGHTLVSDVDADLASYTWRLHPQGYATRYTKEDGKTVNILMHRVILERMLGRPIAEGYTPDHIDGNGFDNRRVNLCERDKYGQNRNRRMFRNNTSGYRGVRAARRKWVARSGMTIDGRFVVAHLGTFERKEDAARAYDRWAVATFGLDAAYINFPGDYIRAERRAS